MGQNIETLEGFSLLDSTRGLVVCKRCKSEVHHTKQQEHTRLHHPANSRGVEPGHTMAEILGVAGVSHETGKDSDPFDVNMDDLLK
jgi:hypothetical protein